MHVSVLVLKGWALPASAALAWGYMAVDTVELSLVLFVGYLQILCSVALTKYFC